MANFERRLERLEQDMRTNTNPSNAILVLAKSGEDEATKIAEAKRARGLADDDVTRRLIVVRFVAPARGDSLPASVSHG